ncbi:MAG: family 16 glycosylhydrolase [Paludibacteraceae bacterium]|nr:family 16 glycosylhydrolase [Paludibacteraceae bacterium]
MKRTLLSLGLFCIALIQTHAAYELVWADEFECDNLNTTTWTYETGTGNWGWGNGESQYYTSRPDNVKVEDGKLVITAKRESYNGSDFTSARIKTQGKVQCKYGRIEALIKVPQGKAGVWPAFWMLGTARGGAWPYCGEFDIMEVMCTGDATTWRKTLNTYHWNNNGINGGYQNVNYGQSYTYSENLSNGFHVYGMEWTPTQVRGYFKATPTSQEITVCTMSNGDATNESNGRYAFVGYEAYMILNVALGGSYVSYNVAEDFQSGQMLVDWIRIYQDRTTYPGSILNSNTAECSGGDANEPDTDCDNPFRTYTAQRNVVNEGGNWNEVGGLSAYNGTTLTVNANGNYANLYAVYSGMAKTLKSNTQYRLSGTITATKASTVSLYIESKNDNTNQLFKNNTLALTANTARNFSVTATPEQLLTSPDVVLSVDNGPANTTYTITNVRLAPVSCPSAVNEASAAVPEISVYPNPASDRVRLSGDQEIRSLKVVSMNGGVLPVPYSADTREVEVAGLTPGIYFLRVEFLGGATQTVKFIKK